MDKASELIVCSRRLEEKSQELEAATTEPLTSIRAFSEIVHDHPDLPVEERREFLQIIVRESERLTRLLNDILDQDKMAGHCCQEPCDSMSAVGKS
jgi:signal transduction histidine kinase